MSIKINITVGDARLIQKAKERAAANQQALEVRTETEKQEIDSADAVQTAAQEQDLASQASNFPNTRLPRRPAAQRRKTRSSKDGSDYRILFVNNTNVTVVENSVKLFNPGPWLYTWNNFKTEGILTCPPDSFRPDGYTLSNNTSFRDTAFTKGIVDNSYSEYTASFAPLLSFADATYNLPTRIKPQTTDRLARWLTEISNFIREFTTVCGSPFRITTFSGYVVSTGPAFPRSTVAPKFIRLLPLISTTSDAIFFSCVIRERIYNLASAIGGSYITQGIGANLLNTTKTVTTRDYTYTDYGYYVRFDIPTKTVQNKLVQLDTGFSTSIPSTIPATPSTFISAALRLKHTQNFYSDDPRTVLLTTVGNNSDTRQALDVDVSNFAYSPVAGLAYFNASPRGDELSSYIYETNVTINSPYSEIYQRLKQGKDFITSGTTAPETFDRGGVFRRRQVLSLPPPFTLVGIVPPTR